MIGFESPSSQNNSDVERPIPKGHPPIAYKDGEYFCPERGRVVPQFPIGPDEYHRNLFIEYERTFGRGLAFDTVHSTRMTKYIPETRSEKLFFEKFGEGVIEEYHALNGAIRLMLRGSQQECEEMIKRLRDYRGRHQGLYSDVREPQERKTFIIHDD